MRLSFKRGLWSLVSRMFGASRGRHVIGAPPPPTPSPAPTASSAPAVGTRPPVEPAVPLAPGVAASTAPSATPVGGASPPPVPVPAGLATIRLIFADGSVVPLPEGSHEGRRAQHLARSVLEAGRPR
jgi:hypothetical protein